MEDFTRELKAGAALFLLYGESGVGKTRLLQELSQSRLADSRIHWVDLSEGSTSGDSLQDDSRQIESLFSSAQQGDIIIADHFEAALKKTRHQLFVNWSTDGIDRQLNLIIASDTEGFNELRQLSQQYQVRVQSFQQMPFSADEVDAFVGFYLFPDDPLGKLSIPATVRKQLAATRGTVGKVIDIIERDGAQVKSSPTTDSGSLRKGSMVIATVFVLFLLTVGVGWYYLGNQSSLVEIEPGLATTEAKPTTMVEPVVETATATVTEAEVEPVTEVVVNLEAEVAEEQPAELKLEPEPEVQLEAETEMVPEIETAAETAPASDTVAEPAAQATFIPESGITSDTEALIVEEEESTQQDSELPGETTISSEQVRIEASDMTRFQRELKKSYDWVASKAASVGTMQILMLSFKTFDEAVYYKYVDSLASKQVDVTQLRVFRTRTGGSEFYSVFYGEYASWQAAKKAKGSLPEVLRKTSPIARSVGGILKEIRRLEAES
jgi:septal ring-binding cell division protein DamX